MKQDILSSLRKELEGSFGRKIISSRDCNQLVEDIYQKTGETVNANTLRRFFGLVKADYPPSTSTLTILSKYCGFNSVEEIKHLSTQKDPDTAVNKEEVLRYMVSLFRNTLVSGSQEKTFYPLVEQTIVFLERNPSLIDRFQREIARTATGQYYYYEKLANIDRLEGYYGDGLRHYLREKNNEEGRLFAHSMQVFRYWLTSDRKQLVKHMSEIATIIPASNIPDHILGRFIAAKIYFAHIKDEPIEGMLADTKRYHAGIIARREDSAFSFPDFEMIICEALALTGHYDEAAEYIWHGKTFLSTSGQDKNTLFNLWDDFVHQKKEPKSASGKHSGHSTVFYHSFSKKYSTIISLLCSGTLKSKSHVLNSQLSDLVKETGYQQLLKLPG